MRMSAGAFGGLMALVVSDVERAFPSFCGLLRQPCHVSVGGLETGAK